MLIGNNIMHPKYNEESVKLQFSPKKHLNDRILTDYLQFANCYFD